MNTRTAQVGLVMRAAEVAAIAHAGQWRKDGRTPYVSHVASVGLILAKGGYCDEIIAAGLLHDVLEDTEWTRKQLAEEVGEEVVKLVEEASESDKSLSWIERKLETINKIGATSLDAKRVIAADKYHNLKTLLADLDNDGGDVWDRFTTRASGDHVWYYGSMADELVKYCDEPVFQNLKQAADRLRELYKQRDEE